MSWNVGGVGCRSGVHVFGCQLLAFELNLWGPGSLSHLGWPILFSELAEPWRFAVLRHCPGPQTLWHICKGTKGVGGKGEGKGDEEGGYFGLGWGGTRTHTRKKYTWSGTHTQGHKTTRKGHWKEGRGGGRGAANSHTQRTNDRSVGSRRPYLGLPR